MLQIYPHPLRKHIAGTLWDTFKDVVENLYKQFKSENAENAIAEDVEQG